MGEAVRDGPDRIWRDFAIGLAISFVLIMLNWRLERSPLGPWLQNWEFGLEQGLLGLGGLLGLNEFSPVAVLDIGGQPELTPANPPAAPSCVDRRGPVTPRRPLLALLEALVRLDPPPVAIGVDIDFSPACRIYVSPNDDPWFFSHILDLRKTTHVPIYLGVFETQNDSPDRWLITSEFSQLAVSIYKPDDPRTMLSIVNVNGHAGNSMSRALAMAYISSSKSHAHNTEWPSWFATSTLEWPSDEASDVENTSYLADFSSLEQMRHEMLSTADPHTTENQGRRFSRKVVLIGDGTHNSSDDSFMIPGRGPERFPGIFFHACGVRTLIGYPLSELTLQFRIVLDVFVSLLTLGGIVFIRFRYCRINTVRIATRRLATACFGLAACVFLVWLLVFGLRRFIWSDWVLIVLALLLHPRIELWLGRLVKAVTKVCKRWFEEPT